MLISKLLNSVYFSLISTILAFFKFYYDKFCINFELDSSIIDFWTRYLSSKRRENIVVVVVMGSSRGYTSYHFNIRLWNSNFRSNVFPGSIENATHKRNTNWMPKQCCTFWENVEKKMYNVMNYSLRIIVGMILIFLNVRWDDSKLQIAMYMFFLEVVR